MSKGSTPRPFGVDHHTFQSNWERIFGQKNTQPIWDHYSDLPAPDAYQDNKEESKCNG
jgi:hypothetical protein